MAQEITRLEAAARENDPAAAVRYPAPATLSEVRRKLLADRRALLAFFWGEREVYAWWATATEVRAANLGPADALAAQVSFLRAALEDPASAADWRLAAHRLHERLIAPLQPAPAREILVIADGPLAYLPVEVLLPAATSRPWGVTHRFLYGPSASVLAALASAPPGDAAAEGTLLALGYSPPAPRSDGPRPGRDEDGRGGPIPHAVSEAREAAALFGAGRAASLVGERASLAHWRSLHPERYRYLHFAAHARVSDRQPEETHLVLAGGALHLAAIRRLRLDADLVVLSACDTGLGPRVHGEGVIGLPHAFLAAGARGAVVALWRVDDRRAKQFMLDFYRRLRRGQPPAEALRQVRASWAAAADERSHPARWAPFVLVGAGNA